MAKTKDKQKSGAPVAFSFFTLFLALFEASLQALLVSLAETKKALKAAEKVAEAKGKEVNEAVSRQTSAKKSQALGLTVTGAPTDDEIANLSLDLIEAEAEVAELKETLVEVQEAIKEAFAPFDESFLALGLLPSGWGTRGIRYVALRAPSAEEAAEVRSQLREAGVEVRDLRNGVELTFVVKL